MSTKCIVCLHTYNAKNHSELITKPNTVKYNKSNQLQSKFSKPKIIYKTYTTGCCFTPLHFFSIDIQIKLLAFCLGEYRLLTKTNKKILQLRVNVNNSIIDSNS